PEGLSHARFRTSVAGAFTYSVYDAAMAAVDERTLGRTGARVLPVSLGGEGILRTTGRAREALPVILEALRLGVRYCDTAPAYQQSQDYYGEAFRAAGAGARDRVFLASKTHERSRDRALRLLDDFAAPPGHRSPGPVADARPARAGRDR